MAQDAVAARVEIAKLRFQLARYRRAEFGRSPEKLAREADQLELAIETLEADQVERIAAVSPVMAAAIEAASEAQKPARRPLPEHLPRESILHQAPHACPSCGSPLRRIGEDVTETLDYVPGRFKVVQHVREKLSCRPATSSSRRRRQITRLPAAAPGRDCWPISSSRSTTIICRYTDRLRSSPARASTWRPRPWPGGSGQPRRLSNR